MDISLLGMDEMQSLIGINDELTESILHRLKTIPPARAFLPIYTVLLLERFETTLPLVERAMSEDLDLGFIGLLQSSKFYLHRMAVPLILRTHSFQEKRAILRVSLRDEICEVVKKTVSSISTNNPFDSEELLEIAMELYRSRYTMVKVLSADILALIGESSFLLVDLVRSANWRIRLKVASKVAEFNEEDRAKIAQELVRDPVDEVRIELAAHISSQEQIELLDDPNPTVRGNYLEQMIQGVSDETVLRRVLDDPSWEVRKKLLVLKGEQFRRITIPLIRNKTEGISWREKVGVLLLVEANVDDELTAKMLMMFLLKHLRDKVCEIRRQAQRILVRIVKHHKWIVEYFYELEAVATSQNYLHRISVVPVVVEYDLRFKTDLGRRLKNDRVLNVRECFIDYCRTVGEVLEYAGVYEGDGDTSICDSPQYTGYSGCSSI